MPSCACSSRTAKRASTLAALHAQLDPVAAANDRFAETMRKIEESGIEGEARLQLMSAAVLDWGEALDEATGKSKAAANAKREHDRLLAEGAQVYREKRLAWGGDKRFERYRETDAKGNKRARRALRKAILAASRAGVTIVTGNRSEGFTCDETRSPMTLKRFSAAASAEAIASQDPEFEEEP